MKKDHSFDYKNYMHAFVSKAKRIKNFLRRVLLFRESEPSGRFNLNLALLQNVRFMLALIEKYPNIYVPVEFKPNMDYLNKYFNYQPKYGDKNVGSIVNISFAHDKPFVRIGKQTWPLLFPMQMIEKCSQVKQKDCQFNFIGIKTTQRVDFLTEWLKNHLQKDIDLTKENEYRWDHSEIVFSNKGREFPVKTWDDDYYSQLQRSKFVLCPNGDYVWTYRFFEAVMCRAIPVIEDCCDIYECFKFYTKETPLNEILYEESWIENNLQQLIKRFTL